MNAAPWTMLFNSQLCRRCFFVLTCIVVDTFTFGTFEFD